MNAQKRMALHKKNDARKGISNGTNDERKSDTELDVLSNAIYSALEEEAKEKEREPRTYFYATESSDCPRGLYMKFFPDKYKPADRHGRVYLIFKVGDVVHERLVEYLKKKKYAKETESHVTWVDAVNDIEIHGRVDAILKKGFPLEIKSIASWGFQKICKDNKPKEENVRQLMVYIKALNKPKGKLLYMNKDNSHLKEFTVHFNPEVFDDIIDLFKQVKEAISKKNIPDVPETAKETKWPCLYCPYQGYCFK